MKVTESGNARRTQYVRPSFLSRFGRDHGVESQSTYTPVGEP